MSGSVLPQRSSSGLVVGDRPRTLLYFSTSYPFDAARETTFIAPQLDALTVAFERVVLIPFRGGGIREAVPNGIEVEEGLIGALDGVVPLIRAAWAGFTSRLTRLEFRQNPGLVWRPRAWLRVLRSSGRAELTRRWLDAWLISHGLDSQRVIACTFWFDFQTLGAVLAKAQHPKLKVATRVNGYDLYLERHGPPWIPHRDWVVPKVDRFFAGSTDARAYLESRYPPTAAKIDITHLGTPDPGFITRASSNGRFVVVSASGAVPIKRLDLVIEALRELAGTRPEHQFEWHHFGDGALLGRLRSQAESLGANLTTIFHGHVTPEELMSFYRTHAVDVFINASASEGGAPVAILEAASCGIPIVATAAGGNVDVVSNMNGELVPKDASAGTVALALAKLVDRPDLAAAKRVHSRIVWEESFRSGKAASHFAERLLSIPDESDDEQGNP